MAPDHVASIYALSPATSRGRVGLIAALMLTSTLIFGSAQAQTAGGDIGEITDEAASAAHAGNAPLKNRAKDFIIVPIPQLSPTLGVGGVLAAGVIYRPGGSTQPWTTGVGLLYTSRKSWAFGAYHRMSLANDRYRVMALGGHGDFKLDFYGIGPLAGERGVSIDIAQRGTLALAEAQIRLAPGLYIGPRVQMLKLSTRIQSPVLPFPDLELPAIELASKIALAGPSLQYDNRDNTFNPRTGEYLTAQLMFGAKVLGSDFRYTRLNAAANLYRPLGATTVVAARASICGRSEDAPFYDLCLYGQSSDLRGYSAGQYRDRATWAGQVELRQKLVGRFGGVVFAGIGGVAPSLGKIGKSEILPSAGAGLRYEVSPENRVNLSFDFAVGKDSKAAYFSLSEAF